MTAPRIRLIVAIITAVIVAIVELLRPPAPCCAPRNPPGVQTPAPVPTLYVAPPITPAVGGPVVP